MASTNREAVRYSKLLTAAAEFLASNPHLGVNGVSDTYETVHTASKHIQLHVSSESFETIAGGRKLTVARRSNGYDEVWFWVTKGQLSVLTLYRHDDRCPYRPTNLPTPEAATPQEARE